MENLTGLLSYSTALSRFDGESVLSGEKAAIIETEKMAPCET